MSMHLILGEDSQRPNSNLFVLMAGINPETYSSGLMRYFRKLSKDLTQKRSHAFVTRVEAEGEKHECRSVPSLQKKKNRPKLAQLDKLRTFFYDSPPVLEKAESTFFFWGPPASVAPSENLFFFFFL